MMQRGPATQVLPTKPEGHGRGQSYAFLGHSVTGSTNLLLAPTGKPQLGSLAAPLKAGHTPIKFSLQQGVEQSDNEEGTC